MNLSLNFSKGLKKVLTVVILVILLFLSVLLFVLPQFNAFAQKLNDRKQIQTQLSDVDLQIKQVDELAKKIEQISAGNIEKLNRALPSKDDSEEFVVNINNLSQSANLVIVNLDLRPAEAQTDTGVPTDLNLYQMNIAVRGNYNNIMVFLDSLERYARLIDVNNLTISSTGGSNTAASASQVLQVDITASMYYLKPIPEVPAFPYGLAVDTTLFENKQFQSLQVLGISIPSINQILPNPFAPQ